MERLTELNEAIESLQEELRLTNSIEYQLVLLKQLRALIQERHAIKNKV